MAFSEDGTTLYVSEAGMDRVVKITGPFLTGSGSNVTATKTAMNLATGSSTVFKPGDTIQYTVVLSNSGGASLNDGPGDEFTDTITDFLVMPNTGATATSGVITYDYTKRIYSWNGSIQPAASVTLTFSVRISSGLQGTRRVCNQGFAGDVATTDPTPLPGTGTQTCVDVMGRPEIGTPLEVKGFEALWLPARSAMQFAALGTGIKEIHVQVFSLSGKRVYASGWVENGHEWKLQDKTGEVVANGVYLYVVIVRGYEGAVRTQVKKLIIAR